MKKINYNEKNIIDLIQCISNNFGTNFENTEKIKQIDSMLNLKKKVLLILLDGLGYYKVQKLNNNSILKKNCIAGIQTVNPSSTACVLTSLCTASFPENHGILGWWSYNKSKNLNYYSLLLRNRITGKTISEENISINDLIKGTSVFERYNCKTNMLMNKYIVNSEYSIFFGGKYSDRTEFDGITDAFDKAKISTESHNFTYLYIDDIDTLSHYNGVDSKQVNKAIEQIEKRLNNLCDNKDEELSIVIIADHGQVDMDEMIYLNKNNDYSKYFYALPSFDTRTLSFFVKANMLDSFKTQFINEFGDDFILISNNELKSMNMFGNKTNNELLEDSLGEFIAIAKTKKFMVCDEVSKEKFKEVIGNHSGFEKEELTIPLIVI